MGVFMKNVLVVEQEPILLAILQKRLEAEGFNTVGCSDGLKAKELIRTFSPNYIISNLLIPFYSGQEILLLAKEQSENIRVIILALLSQEDVRDSLLKLGADAYFYKPFDLEELVNAIFQFEPESNFAD